MIRNTVWWDTRVADTNNHPMIKVRNNYSFQERRLAEDSIDRRRQFIERVEEPVAESVSELSSTLFDGVQLWRIRRERDTGKSVTDLTARDD